MALHANTKLIEHEVLLWSSVPSMRLCIEAGDPQYIYFEGLSDTVGIWGTSSANFNH